MNANFSCQQGVTENSAPEAASTDAHALSANLRTDVSDATLTGAGSICYRSEEGTTSPSLYPAPFQRGTFKSTTLPSLPTVGSTPPGAATTCMSKMAVSRELVYGSVFGDGVHGIQGQRYLDHSKDTPISQVIVDPLNVTITGGAVTSFVDVRNGQTLSASSHAAVFNYVLSNIYHGWMDVGTPPSGNTQWISGGTTYNVLHVVKSLGRIHAPGAYRLRVDMLDYQGLRPGDDAGASLCSRAHKGYSVQLAVPSGGSYTECADPGCQVSALDELAVYTPIQSAGAAGFSLPLFQVPADYAGQTINFYIFDVGDVSGNNQISIQNPDPTSCGGTAPCLFTSSSPVPVYDLGYSLNTAPTPSLLVNTEELRARARRFNPTRCRRSSIRRYSMAAPAARPPTSSMPDGCCSSCRSLPITRRGTGAGGT